MRLAMNRSRSRIDRAILGRNGVILALNNSAFLIGHCRVAWVLPREQSLMKRLLDPHGAPLAFASGRSPRKITQEGLL